MDGSLDGPPSPSLGVRLIATENEASAVQCEAPVQPGLTWLCGDLPVAHPTPCAGRVGAKPEARVALTALHWPHEEEERRPQRVHADENEARTAPTVAVFYSSHQLKQSTMLILVGLFFVLYPTVLCISLVVTRSQKASDEPRDTLFSILLSVFAFAAHSYCNWFQWRDGESRKKFDDYSYKYVLISLPQLLSVFVIGYYAVTFKRRGSEFTHQLMAESCVHQFVITALVLAVLHGGFHMMNSGCCAFPVICPVDVSTCLLNDIFQCPTRLENTPHYDFVYRAIQVLATFLLLIEMSIVAPIHRFKHLQSRVRRAAFLTFDRNRGAPQRPTSPTVPMC